MAFLLLDMSRYNNDKGMAKAKHSIGIITEKNFDGVCSFTHWFSQKVGKYFIPALSITL